MNIAAILKGLYKRMQVRFFPSLHDKEVKRWFNDGGDERFRYNYNLNSESLVLDFGGYKGQWTSDIYSMYNCRIMVFEPVNIFANRIKDRFKFNPKIEVFNIALGKNRRQEIISLEADGSSVYSKFNSGETIQFEDVIVFFKEHSIDIIDLMKINIEGGEYELLERLIEADLIKKIRNIQIQFHNVQLESVTKMETIRQSLSKTHVPTYQYIFVWENWELK